MFLVACHVLDKSLRFAYAYVEVVVGVKRQCLSVRCRLRGTPVINVGTERRRSFTSRNAQHNILLLHILLGLKLEQGRMLTIPRFT